ncbi:MAG: TetR/AcrR family transcriptional regulator [Actinomycetota bacterium]|nr:TetR/AcrR family transcriptional regulator [Actinomycetota bacterium]
MATLQPTDYYETALRLLAEGGAALVTIDGLCERLAVTKGSFYHHFRNRPVFVRHMLLYWEEAYGRRLAEEALEVADPQARIARLEELAVTLNHGAERAIRILAATDPFAAEVQRRVDDGRSRIVAKTLSEAGLESEHARGLGEVGMTLLIGAQQMGTHDQHRVGQVLAEYRRWVDAAVAGLASEARR